MADTFPKVNVRHQRMGKCCNAPRNRQPQKNNPAEQTRVFPPPSHSEIMAR
jgi:hypothetical protein